MQGLSQLAFQKPVLCVALVLLSSHNFANPNKPGGDTTTTDIGRNAFSLPAGNLSLTERDKFFIGNAFFRNPWVSAPASTSARDGLGPLFNANACQACHVKDGRGRPPLKTDESFRSILVRLSIPSTNSQQAVLKTSGAVPEPNYGSQLNGRAINGVTPEATATLRYEFITGRYSDGVEFELRKPVLEINNLGYGSMHPKTQYSLRVAPAMIGMGLLEAIPEDAMLALADEQDTNSDGISGKTNIVFDIANQSTALGRFGWKATQPTVAQQSAGAFHGDMGLTSSLFPQTPCTVAQRKCTALPDGGTPEVQDKIFRFVEFYASHLAVPKRRNANDKQVLQGQQLFSDAACANCHVPVFTTKQNASSPQLSEQVIYPYTDLLLHDMGAGLADDRPVFRASGREWRTPPLWGVGLIPTVNGHNFLLHDGRARGVAEAILWHGGEAEASRQSFLNMSAEERKALIMFVESL